MKNNENEQGIKKSRDNSDDTSGEESRKSRRKVDSESDREENLAKKIMAEIGEPVKEENDKREGKKSIRNVTKVSEDSPASSPVRTRKSLKENAEEKVKGSRKSMKRIAEVEKEEGKKKIVEEEVKPSQRKSTKKEKEAREKDTKLTREKDVKEVKGSTGKEKVPQDLEEKAGNEDINKNSQTDCEEKDSLKGEIESQSSFKSQKEEEKLIKTPTRRLSERKCSSPFNTKDFIVDMPKRRKSEPVKADKSDKEGVKIVDKAATKADDKETNDKFNVDVSSNGKKEAVKADSSKMSDGKVEADTNILEQVPKEDKPEKNVTEETGKTNENTSSKQKSPKKAEITVQKGPKAEMTAPEQNFVPKGKNPLRKSILKVPKVSAENYILTRKSVKFNAEIALSNTMDEEKGSANEEFSREDTNKLNNVGKPENKTESDVRKRKNSVVQDTIRENLSAIGDETNVGTQKEELESKLERKQDAKGIQIANETVANVNETVANVKNIEEVTKVLEVETPSEPVRQGEPNEIGVFQKTSQDSASTKTTQGNENKTSLEENTGNQADKQTVPEVKQEVKKLNKDDGNIQQEDADGRKSVASLDKSKKKLNISRVELNIRKKTIQEIYHNIHLYRSNDVTIGDIEAVHINSKPLLAYEKFKNQILYNSIKFLLSDNIIYAVTDSNLKHIFDAGIHMNNTTVSAQHCTILTNQTLSCTANATLGNKTTNDTLGTTIFNRTGLATYRLVNSDTKIEGRYVNHMLIKNTDTKSFNFISNFSFVLLSQPVTLNADDLNIRGLWSTQHLADMLIHFNGLNSVNIFLVTVLCNDKNLINKKFKTNLADKLKRLGSVQEYYVKYLDYTTWTYRQDLPPDYNMYEEEDTLIRIENVSFKFYIAEASAVTKVPEVTEEAEVTKEEEVDAEMVQENVDKAQEDKEVAQAQNYNVDKEMKSVESPSKGKPIVQDKEIDTDVKFAQAEKKTEAVHELVREENAVKRNVELIQKDNDPKPALDVQLEKPNENVSEVRNNPETSSTSEKPSKKTNETVENTQKPVDIVIKPNQPIAIPETQDDEKMDTPDRSNSLEVIESSQENSHLEGKPSVKFACSTPFPVKQAPERTASLSYTSSRSVDTLERPIIESASSDTGGREPSPRRPARLDSPRVSRIFPPKGSSGGSPPRAGTPRRGDQSPRKASTAEDRRNVLGSFAKKSITPPQQPTLGKLKIPLSLL